MNHVVLLYGKPSTGKLTIAKYIKEILASQGKVCHIFDNHFFNDIVFPYVNITKYLGNICESVYKIRKIFLDTVSKYSEMQETTFVFTNVLLDTEDDTESVNELKKFAKAMKADFIPVQIVAGDESILDWCSNKDRKTKQKLTDREAMRSFINKACFMDLENSVVIKNTDWEKTVKFVEDFVKNNLC